MRFCQHNSRSFICSVCTKTSGKNFRRWSALSVNPLIPGFRLFIVLSLFLLCAFFYSFVVDMFYTYRTLGVKCLIIMYMKTFLSSDKLRTVHLQLQCRANKRNSMQISRGAEHPSNSCIVFCTHSGKSRTRKYSELKTHSNSHPPNVSETLACDLVRNIDRR